MNKKETLKHIIERIYGKGTMYTHYTDFYVLIENVVNITESDDSVLYELDDIIDEGMPWGIYNGGEYKVLPTYPDYFSACCQQGIIPEFEDMGLELEQKELLIKRYRLIRKLQLEYLNQYFEKYGEIDDDEEIEDTEYILGKIDWQDIADKFYSSLSISEENIISRIVEGEIK